MLALWGKLGLRLYSLGRAGLDNLKSFDFQTAEFLQFLLLLACLIGSISFMCYWSR